MWLIIGLGIFGTLCSVFLGGFAVRILVFNGQEPQFLPGPKPGWQWWVFQIWFNFICSLSGWAVVIQYIHRYQSEPSKFSFTGADAVPLLVGLLGITGLLPRALWAFSDLAGEMAKKLANLPDRKHSNK